MALQALHIELPLSEFSMCPSAKENPFVNLCAQLLQMHDHDAPVVKCHMTGLHQAGQDVLAFQAQSCAVAGVKINRIMISCDGI